MNLETLAAKAPEFLLLKFSLTHFGVEFYASFREENRKIVVIDEKEEVHETVQQWTNSIVQSRGHVDLPNKRRKTKGFQEKLKSKVSSNDRVFFILGDRRLSFGKLFKYKSGSDKFSEDDLQFVLDVLGLGFHVNSGTNRFTVSVGDGIVCEVDFKSQLHRVLSAFNGQQDFLPLQGLGALILLFKLPKCSGFCGSLVKFCKEDDRLQLADGKAHSCLCSGLAEEGRSKSSSCCGMYAKLVKRRLRQNDDNDNKGSTRHEHRSKEELIGMLKESRRLDFNKRQKEKKIDNSNMEHVQIDEAESQGLSDLFRNAVNNLTSEDVNKYPPQFLQMVTEQLDMAENKKRQWSSATITWALNVHSSSPQAYRVLKEIGIVKLPSESTLRRRNSHCFEYGWTDESIRQLRTALIAAGSSENALVGGLSFDEIYLQDGLVFNLKTKRLVGYVAKTASELEDWIKKKAAVSVCVDLLQLTEQDNGDVNYKAADDTTATHALQFMWMSLDNSFSFPLAFFPTRTANAAQIFDWFWEGVALLDLYGFETVFAVCDGANANREFIKLHNPQLVNGCNAEGEFVAHIIENECIPGKRIILISDAVHVTKKLRNNLYKSYLNDTTRSLYIPNYVIEGKNAKENGSPEKTLATWAHLRTVLYEDQYRTTGIRLKEAAVNITPWGKMRVEYVSNVTQPDVLMALRESEARCNGQALRKSSTATVWFLDVISRFKKITYSSHRNQDLSFVAPLLKIEEDFAAWKESSDSPSDFISHQSWFDLRLAINGIVCVVREMVKREIFIITKDLSQNRLEGYFGQIRHINGRVSAQQYATRSENLKTKLSKGFSYGEAVHYKD